MLTFAGESLKALERELLEANTTSDENYSKILKCQEISRKYCEQLLQKALAYEFKDLAEQIQFFKISKPNLFAHLFYYNKIRSIESKCFGNNIEFRKMLLIEEMGKKVNFFDSHYDLYRYYKSNRTDCDYKYFSKFDSYEIKHFGQGCEEIMLTTQDLIFSKFIAYENVERYLVDELQKIVYADCPQEKSGALHKIRSLGIQWTGSDRDLVELIYGLSLSKCFNNGNIKLTRILEGIKFIFNVSMSNEDFYNIGSQVRNRKKGNEISFFEKLKSVMQNDNNHFLK